MPRLLLLSIFFKGQVNLLYIYIYNWYIYANVKVWLRQLWTKKLASKSKLCGFLQALGNLHLVTLIRVTLLQFNWDVSACDRPAWKLKRDSNNMHMQNHKKTKQQMLCTWKEFTKYKLFTCSCNIKKKKIAMEGRRWRTGVGTHRETKRKPFWVERGTELPENYGIMECLCWKGP